MSDAQFLGRLSDIVSHYLAHDAGQFEHLSLLRWQIAEGHALESRETYPGHITTSAVIVSPDLTQTLLIAHQTIGRWLQPGGHYEPSPRFWLSAQREAMEETGLTEPQLHPWHKEEDRPFVIDSHDVPGKKSRNEPAHIHHDLQYIFVASPDAALNAQLDEVDAAQWHKIEALREVSPKVWQQINRLKTPDQRAI